MELYVEEDIAPSVIDIAASLGVEAKVVGRVEDAPNAQVTIKSPFGEFQYNKT
jgi:phosphoribosylformylglycinamidine cyclo-ligase